MVKKSVLSAASPVYGTFKGLFNSQNILSSIIVILLVVYMSFVSTSNVPKLFNNVIVKLLLFGLIVYTFFQDKMVSLILTATVILSITLAQSSKNRKSDIESENYFNDNDYTVSENLPSGVVGEENTLNTSVNYQDQRMN